MSDRHLLAKKVGEALKQRNLMLTAAESCTGGGVAYEITSVPGSSEWFDRGFVTYTNRSKQEMLGVSEATLIAHGAVSEETVLEMAAGAIKHSAAQLSLAISGIAGPGGATEHKPVGMVCFAWGYDGVSLYSEVQHFSGNRDEVREQSITHALQGVLGMLDE